ncbi:MAG: HD domain-containing protein [Synergistales bacterium]|nr:HD domain-containing protein [Synergistales bacterium]
MEKMELSITRQWFDSFALSFCDDHGDLHPLLELKYRHSYRVEKNAMAISRSIGWNDNDVYLARAAGVVHDVGRFPQFHLFGTFCDPLSVDHGKEGERVLEEQFPWEYLDPELKRILLGSTCYHNVIEIPENLMEEEFLPLLKVIRDADKLDVFEIVRENILEGKTRELFPGISMAPSLSEDLLKEVKEHKRASYGNVRTLLDFLLLQLTWIYDINFSPTITMMRERGIIQWLEEQLSIDNRAEPFLEGFVSHVHRRIG